MPDYDYALAFVASIAANPTVRLDLANGTRGPWNLRDGSAFNPPPLKRSQPSTMLMDGSAPSAAAYDNREIVLKLQLLNLTKDQAATQLQNLMRELDRTTNILMHRPQTTAPVFFKTYRSGPESIEFDPVNEELTVTIMAEPFAYGLEESQGPFTVNNDAAAGSNGMFFDVTAVKGDVETPLNLTISNGVVGTGRRRTGIGVRRRGDVTQLPLVLQAETMTLGGGTSLPGNDVLMTGAGSNYARVSFASVNLLLARVTTATRFPTTASVDARGTYRVFCRIRQSSITDVLQMQLEWGGVDIRVTNAIVNTPQDTGPGTPTIKYVDLGEIQIPIGYDPVTRGPSGVEIATEGVYLSVLAGRAAGTAANTLDIDQLLLLPADDRLTVVKWPENATVTDFILEGGPRPGVYARNASAQITSTQAPEIAGGGLMLTPNRTNRVVFARDIGLSTSVLGAGDSKSATTTVTANYFPRYLMPLRPVST